jgi:hypothetical protein
MVEQSVCRVSRLSKRLFLLLAVSVGLITPIPEGKAIEDSRSRLIPIPGSPNIARIVGPFDTRIEVGDIEIDEATRRVFVSLPTANRVVAVNFDGSEAGTVEALRPGEMTLGPDGVYVVEQTIGSISRINRTTLDRSIVASGLNTPRGLTLNAGLLYTTSTESPTGTSYEYLLQVNPTSGNKSFVNSPGITGLYFQSMVDPSPIPGVIFGSSTESFPNKLMRVEVGNSAPSALLGETFACASALDNGELLLGLGSQAYAANSRTLDDASRRWPREWTDVQGCGAGGGAVAVIRSGRTEQTQGIQIDVREQQNPGRFIRGFVFADGSFPANRTRMSRDGSLIVVAAIRDGGIDLFLLPGVSQNQAPSSNARPVVPADRVTVPPLTAIRPTTGRVSAPQLGSLPPVELAVEDWMIDSPGGHIFTTNAFQSAVNVLDLDGNPIASIRNLPSPSGMTICNGVVYLSLFGSSQIVRLLSQPTWSTELVTDQVPRPRRLICVGTTLFAISERATSPETLTEAIYRINGSQATSLPLTRSSSFHSRFGTDTAIFSYGSDTVEKFDTITNTRAFAPVLVPVYNALRQFIHFYPGKEKFLDSAGNRFNTATLLPDGVRFAGSMAIVSQTSPPYVAVTNGNTISILDGNDPNTTIREFTVDPSVVIVDQEFVPGSNKLRVLILRRTGQYAVVAAPDIL